MKAYSYIRWSSAQQTTGHSRERQTGLAAEYAAKHKLTLDNSSFQDHGVSAYRGKNVSQGKLGAFIRAIDDGHIDTPCSLLVEDIDRLSRNEIDLGLELLLSLIRRGVTLVTLQDQASYSVAGIRGDGGIASLFIAIVKLQGAHEYSARLGRPVRAAHDKNKRLRTNGAIVTKNAPSWLKSKADKSGWIVIIRLLREARGMVQAELARAIGVSQQAVFAYELGERRVSIYILLKMCKAFIVPLEELVGLVRPAKIPNRRLSPRAVRHAQRLMDLSKTQQRFVVRIIDLLEFGTIKWSANQHPRKAT